MPAKIEIPILIVSLIVLGLVVVIYNNTRKPKLMKNKMMKNIMKNKMMNGNVMMNGRGCVQNCYDKYNDDPWVTASCIDKCN